jgi:branched-chain amino acid transport system substrate-binding protein
MRHALAALLLAGPVLLLGGCGGRGEGRGDVLKVGVILPMTGVQATYGEESWNGLLLAEADLRARGTAVPFRLIRRDEQSKKQEAGNQAKALIETERVHVLIGSVASSHTKQIFQEARESGVPCISPASTNDQLTIEGGPYTSRICFKDGFQGAVLANFALGQGWRQAAVVVDKAQDYSVGLAENFRRVFEQAGGAATFDYYVTEDTDFSNVIARVAGHQPQVIFISGYYEQAGPMIKQAKALWGGRPVIGGDGLDSPELVNLVGDTQAEIYLSSHFAADAPDPHVRSFAERYKARFGKSPGAMAALGYDVLLVLMDAVARTENPFDAAALARAIAATSGVEGITGRIDLTTEDRTPSKDAVIVKVEGGLTFHSKIPAVR